MAELKKSFRDLLNETSYYEHSEHPQFISSERIPVEINGALVTSVQTKVTSIDPNSGLNAEYFKIQSYVDGGNVEMLKPNQPMATDFIEESAKLSHVLSQIPTES